MDEYYTIQTPNYHNDLFTELHTLQKQGILCDVTLIAEDGEVMAHKVVLMAASSYFRSKLSPILGLTPSKICLKGISVVELANLIKYIYTGSLVFARESMEVTLEISEILGLTGVIEGYKDILSYEETKKKQSDTPDQSNTSTSQASESLEAPANHGNDNLSTNPVTSDNITQESSTSASEQTLEQVFTSSPQIGTSEEVVESSQSTSTDYDFPALYDQQYMDVTVGSGSPVKISPACGSVTKSTTTSSENHKSETYSASRNIADEEARHQDLLTVAIESLSDAPYLKQGRQEVDKAVMSIAEASKEVSNVNVHKLKDENTIEVEPFVNGKTSTKTVTMSAGTVRNELGGKTDVYTVALDPSSIKSPIVMPRPKRSKTMKEKEAEERAKIYRQKKAELLHKDMSNFIKDYRMSSALNKTDDTVISMTEKSSLKPNTLYKILNGNKKKVVKKIHPFKPDVISVQTEDDSVVDFEVQVNFDSDDDNNDGNDGVNELIANDIVGAVGNSAEDKNGKTATSKDSNEVDANTLDRVGTNYKGKSVSVHSNEKSGIIVINDEQKESINNATTVRSYLIPKVKLKKHTAEDIIKLTQELKKQTVDITQESSETSKTGTATVVKRKLDNATDSDIPTKTKNVVFVKVKKEPGSETDNVENFDDTTDESSDKSSAKTPMLNIRYVDGTQYDPGEDITKTDQWKTLRRDVKTGDIICFKCNKTFKSGHLMRKHYNATHADKMVHCKRCEFVAHSRTSLNSHMKLKHSVYDPSVTTVQGGEEVTTWKCEFCEYASITSYHLTNHLLHAHGLLVMSRNYINSKEKFKKFQVGDIVTLDGQLFDPKTMELPKNVDLPRKKAATNDKKTGTTTPRRSIFKLPSKEFVQVILQRHQEYLKTTDQQMPYMSNSIAVATKQPSFPQASPQIRNSHANKVYSMGKLKCPVPGSGLQGDVGNTSGIPGVDNEVIVTQHNVPEVTIENVEAGGDTDRVVTISETCNGRNGEDMIVINQDGKQTVVRSKDFYETLSATGNESNQTLEVIAALLHAGEQIEIREQIEQEDFVEIQNV
ncbi:BTB And C-terminal Kelch [Mactra antiquata]